jgi:hypothetical protein
MKILAFYNDDPTTVMAKVIDYYRSYRHYVYERNANFFVAA